MKIAQDRLTNSDNNQTITEHPLEVHHLAHDLRGPLNSILGFTELLLDGIEGPLNEYQLADISAINQSARNLLYLINTVVDLSKLEANGLTVSPNAVDLAQVIYKVVHADFGTIKPATVQLAVDLPDNLPQVQGQSSRVEQMLTAVLRFAFRKQADTIALTTIYDAQTVRLDIVVRPYCLDNCETVFRPIATIDNNGHSHLGPGGVDLPLVYQLAKVQHVAVQAERLQNEGTKFSLMFTRAAS